MILERDDLARRARLPARPRPRPLQQVGGRPRLRARRSSPASPPTPTAGVDPAYLDALAAVADDAGLDPAFKALALGLPVRGGDHRRTSPPSRRRRPTRSRSTRARRALEGAVAARARRPAPSALYADERRARALQPRRRRRRPPRAARPGARPPDRARPRGDGGASAQFEAADNMTERMGALGAPRRARPGRGGARALSTPTGRHDRLVDRQVVRGPGGADPARGARSRPSRR